LFQNLCTELRHEIILWIVHTTVSHSSSPRRPGLNSRTVYMGYVVDEVLWVPAVNYYSNLVPYRFISYPVSSCHDSDG